MEQEELKKILKENMNECFDENIQSIKSELFKMNANIQAEIMGNGQTVALLHNEINHIKSDLEKNFLITKDNSDKIIDLMNITVGFDGTNGLRSRINKLESCEKENEEHYDTKLEALNVEINSFKNWQSKIIGITIGLWLIGSIIVGVVINYNINQMYENNKNYKHERVIE